MVQKKEYQFTPRALPTPSTPFIGREEELDSIVRILAEPDCRLLSILGLGGMGKTRLAIQAAKHFSGEFSQGVFFIPLQSLDAIEFIAPTILSKLGIELSGLEDSQVILLNHLQDSECLLVLDNFEHLLAGVDLVMSILELAPAVKLLVTSREALGLKSEWLFPLDGLPYPPPGQDKNCEQYAAIQLFSQHARRANPAFYLHDECEHVIRICQNLEGSPLALEITASWCRSLSTSLIAEQIENNLEFLTTDMQDIPDRHRSLRVVFDQSWAALDTSQRIAYQQLSVFRGGFDLMAAQFVASASLNLIDSLVSKSLITRGKDGRFHIHKVLAQFAEGYLVDSPAEVEEVRTRHCEYYMKFLEQRGEALRGERHEEIRTQIEMEINNIRSAWGWAIEKDLIELIDRAVQDVAAYYTFRSGYLEGMEALEKAIESLEGINAGKDRDKTLAKLYLEQGWLLIRVGELERAEMNFRKSQQIYRDLGIPLPPGQGTDPILGLAILASIGGDYESTGKMGEEGYQRSLKEKHTLNKAFSLFILSDVALLQGKIDQADDYAVQAYAAAIQSNDLWFSAYCLNLLGHAAREKGKLDQAQAHYQASYEIRDGFRDPEGKAVALNHLGEIGLLRGDHQAAGEYFQRSLEIYRELSDMGGLGTAHAGLGRTYFAQGQIQAAKEQFRRALMIAIGIPYMPLLYTLLVKISELLIQENECTRAVELLAMVNSQSTSSYQIKEQAFALLSRCQEALPALRFEEAKLDGQKANIETASLSLQLDLLVQESAEPVPVSSLLIEPLTSRELEVLKLISDGLTNEQIAEQLVISLGTTKWYTSQIYQKLQVNNSTRAVAYARRLKLIPTQ